VTSKADKKKAEAMVHELAPQLPVNSILWVDEHPLSPPPVVPGG
jgi:hypothetical protein